MISCVTFCVCRFLTGHWLHVRLTLGIDDLGSDGSTCGPEGEIESLDFVDLIDLGREETMSVIIPKNLFFYFIFFIAD